MGLRSRWLWVGVAVAVAAWAPVLYWQAAHGWPQLTLAREIRAEYGTPGQRVGFFALQLVLFSLGATYLWVTGVASLWRDDAWRAYRVLAWAWLVVLAILILTAGQGYYPAGIYPVLIAAGAVVAERRGRRVVVGAGRGPGQRGAHPSGDRSRTLRPHIGRLDLEWTRGEPARDRRLAAARR